VPDRSEVFIKGQCYHIFNRTLGQARLFANPADYEYCLQLVRRYRGRYGVAVIAYCLMPDHYHFLLRQEADEPLSKFVLAVFNGYSQAVSRQHGGRTGLRLRGRFRHAWIDCKELLAPLCRYIHLDPVRAKMVSKPESWVYSNYLEWVGRRTGGLSDRMFMHEHFATAETYREFVYDREDEARARDALAPYVWD
jgi:putative transposase